MMIRAVTARWSRAATLRMTSWSCPSATGMAVWGESPCTWTARITAASCGTSSRPPRAASASGGPRRSEPPPRQPVAPHVPELPGTAWTGQGALDDRFRARSTTRAGPLTWGVLRPAFRARLEVRLRPRDLRGPAPCVLGGLLLYLGTAVTADEILVLVDPRPASHAVTEAVDLRPVALTAARKVNHAPGESVGSIVVHPRAVIVLGHRGQLVLKLGEAVPDHVNPALHEQRRGALSPRDLALHAMDGAQRDVRVDRGQQRPDEVPGHVNLGDHAVRPVAVVGLVDDVHRLLRGEAPGAVLQAVIVPVVTLGHDNDPGLIRGVLVRGGRVVAHHDAPPLRQGVFVGEDAGLVELLKREQAAVDLADQLALKLLLEQVRAGVLAFKRLPLAFREMRVLCRESPGGVNAGLGLVLRVGQQIPQQPDSLRGGGDEHPGVLALTQSGHETFVIEGHVADDGELIEPAVRQVLAADRVRLLRREPPDLAVIGEGDLEPVLVVVRYLDTVPPRLGDDSRFTFEADGPDGLVGGGADGEVDAGRGERHLQRPVRTCFRFSPATPCKQNMQPPGRVPFASARQDLAAIFLGMLDVAAAVIALQVKFGVPGMVRRQLLPARPAVFLQGLGLLPPSELREVQSVIFGQETGLNLFRPRLKPFGEVRIGHTPPGTGSVLAAVFRLGRWRVRGVVLIGRASAFGQGELARDVDLHAGHHASSRPDHSDR